MQLVSPSYDLLKRRRKRSIGVDEYFVETAIVADKSMLNTHRREDLEAYLYTLMNIVRPAKNINISIIHHTLPSTIRAVIGTLTCTSMASNSTSDSECY